MSVNLQRVGGAGSDKNDVTSSLRIPTGSTLTFQDPATQLPAAGAAASDLSNPAAQVMLRQRVPRPLPRSGLMQTGGDSQTFGTNYGTSRPYNDGSGNLLAKYKWVQQLADAHAMTLSNFAIGGSRVSWKDGPDSWDRRSIFNMVGRNSSINTTGIMAVMAGWNNLGQDVDAAYDAAYFARLRNAYEAIIARYQIDFWGGITNLGWTATAQVNNPTGWSVTNTTNGQPAADDTTYVPFYWNNTTRDRRYWINIGATTGVVQFQVVDQRAFCVFFDTAPGGGSVTIKVNGASVATYDSNFTAPLSDIFPGVVWVDNIPTGTLTIRVENTSGASVKMLAYGTRSKTFDEGTRHMLLSGPCGNDGGPGNPKPETQRVAAQLAAYQAVQTFSPNYPVSWVETQSQWVESTDQEPTDTSHLTDLGNYGIFRQFLTPWQLPNASSPHFVRMA